MVKKLVRNIIKCKKCDSIIESKHVHDFVECKCGKVFVDGGKDYTRRGFPSGNPDDWIEDLSEYKESEL